MALLAVVGLAASLVWGAPDQDRFARRGRGGPEQLDSVDAFPHSHEVTAPDSTDSGRVVDAVHAREPHRAQAGACLSADIDICAPGPPGRLAAALRIHPRPLALSSHARGRAPPFA